MNSLEERIQQGIEGKFKGLKNGFKDINNYIFNAQRACYTLIGGQSGVYKTSILDYMLANIIEDAIGTNVPLDLFYDSFEIDKLTKQCNWLSRAVYNKYSIIIPPKKIKGLGDNRLTIEEKKIVDDCRPDVEQLFDKIHFNWHPLNPTGIYKKLFNHYKSTGTILTEEYTDDLGNKQRRLSGYKPNNPDAYTIHAIDHLYLAKKENSYSTKDNIDKISEYNILLRNTFGLTSYYLQQFNQGISSVDRQKFKGADLSPSQGDFRDSTSPYADADVVIGLMNPYKLDMESSLGYNVTKLQNKMVMFKIIKNRLDDDNVAKGLYVKPEAGLFFELPDPDSLEIEKYYNHKI